MHILGFHDVNAKILDEGKGYRNNEQQGDPVGIGIRGASPYFHKILAKKNKATQNIKQNEELRTTNSDEKTCQAGMVALLFHHFVDQRHIG